MNKEKQTIKIALNINLYPKYEYSVHLKYKNTKLKMILLLLLLIIILILFYIKKIRQKLALNRFRKNFELKKHLAVFEKLYADIDGFALSRQSRETQDAFEYIYGEILFEPFIALLAQIKLNRSSVFYDLGSGTGKAVIACALVFNVSKSCGIELFSSLHHAAILQKERLMRIPEYQAKTEQIEFRNENFLLSELSDATVIFINSTGFFGEIWRKISKHLEQINAGSLVISTSKPLCSEQFVIQRKVKVAMSWGPIFAFIQQRK